MAVSQKFSNFGLILGLSWYLSEWSDRNPGSILDQSLILQTPNFRHMWHIIDTSVTVFWQMSPLYKYPLATSFSLQVHEDLSFSRFFQCLHNEVRTSPAFWRHLKNYWRSNMSFESRKYKNDIREFRLFKAKSTWIDRDLRFR